VPSITEPPISVLVFTPTPTHPTIQGNRQRVFDICRAMQSMGAEITLLYYAIDGLDAKAAQRMKDAWGNLEVVFPRGFVPQHSLVRYPAVDDWFDDAIGESALRLGAERRFDVCVTNYAWYSKIFASLPQNAIRVIDTHDVFGGRAHRFAEIDLAPEWFHTSVSEEAKGLDRADFVLAIQDIEARTLQQRTKAQVQTVGLLSGPSYLSPGRHQIRRRLKVGYVGSANPFNVSSILSFSRALQASPKAAAGFDVHLAGAICGAVPASPHPFVTHGIVESVADFYRSVDVVVNPMLGGTGLKIKSLEALSYGKPLVATLDAMTGIDTSQEGHRLADVGQIVQRLQELAEHPARLFREAEISRQVFESYRKAQLKAFSRFWSRIEQEVDARRAASATPRRAGAFQ
jgi:glycosyltransferase involved in cell wall biosynthesis